MGLLIVAAAALVDADGRVLVQQRAQGALAGLWEFPGGKIEPGETPETCLVRELAACLAPAAFASDRLGEKPLLLLLFVLRKWRGLPQPLAAAGLRWVRPIELHGLPMPPADKPLIGLLEALL